MDLQTNRKRISVMPERRHYGDAAGVLSYKVTLNSTPSLPLSLYSVLLSLLYTTLCYSLYSVLLSLLYTTLCYSLYSVLLSLLCATPSTLCYSLSTLYYSLYSVLLPLLCIIMLNINM